MEKKDFAVMVKPVGSRCNMRCTYCYYLPLNISHDAVMSLETAEKMIRNCIESSRNNTVSFVWHGGEPTIRGLDFYRKIVEIQQKYLPEGWQCWNNLQTNGLGLTDEWCRFLKENHFDVGISLDGTKRAHDSNRHDVSGNDTYDRIKENIARLQKYGINPDLLCTVNSETVRKPLEVYENLKNMRTGWMQFIPVVNRDPDGTVRDESVTPEEYGDFLCNIFNQWIFNDLGKVNVQLFVELVNMYAGGSASLCWLQETCGNVPVVEADGKVYSCDHFVREKYCIGTVDESFADMLDKPLQKQFGLDKREGLGSKCLNCRYLKLCHGGCPKDRFGEDGQYWLCEGLLKLFRLSERTIRNLVELNGRDRQYIMKELKARELALRNKADRNGPCICGSGLKYKKCCGRYQVR